MPPPRFAPPAPGGSEVTIKDWFYGSSPDYKVATFEQFIGAYYPADVIDASNRAQYEAIFQGVKRLNDTFQPIGNAADQLAVLNHALKPWERYDNLKFELAASAAAADIRILGGSAMKNGIRHRLERCMDWTSQGIDGLRVAVGMGFERNAK